MKRAWSVPLLMAGLAGCGAYSAPSIEVVGGGADLQTLAGAWHGTFRNPQLNRRGQIDFIGRLRGSVMEGSYTSRSEDGRFETNGSWRAERVADEEP